MAVAAQPAVAADRFAHEIVHFEGISQCARATDAQGVSLPFIRVGVGEKYGL